MPSHPASLVDVCWGKADCSVPGLWHPALLHMLDVAAVGLELLHDGLAPALASDLRTPTSGRSMRDAELAFLIACHDLGKLTPGFQAKVHFRREPLEKAGLEFPDLAETNHALGTSDLGPGLLEEAGVDPECADRWAMSAGAHHGRVFLGSEQDGRSTRRYGGSRWRTLRTEGVRCLAEALGANPTLLRDAPSDTWLMALAGITVVADWIGSDTKYFPYFPECAPSPEYVAESRSRAALALSDLGWRGWHSVRKEVSWAGMFPGLKPNAMQRRVIEAADQLEAPSLILIEAPTGCGKTEAALYAAEVQIAKFGLAGTYVALPTQATSNQMFGRVHRFLMRRYPGKKVNLHLLHGLKDQDPGYRGIQTHSINGGDGTAAIVADAWFRGKRRGLLSPFAVGTVDQAMLAALQSRFFQLRMLGLCRKVLVIDEVHAYDAFMSRILDRLLTWLAELGSPVVLLSATLSDGRRRELFKAYSGETVTVSAPYPRIMLAARDRSPEALPIDREGRSREVRLEWHSARAEALAHELGEKLADGGCAAWICNTVGRAQAAYRALIDTGWSVEEVVLFHARFPVETRLEREQMVLRNLARSAARPERLVVVATQVVEQSLDLDFDLLVSELAPVDLLVQRAGRLHRHPERDVSRPEALEIATIWISVEQEGVLPDFGPSVYVYDRHVLLRTWWALRGRSSWRVPEEADELLELVYDPSGPPEGASPELALAWEESARALEDTLAQANMCGSSQLVPPPAPPDADQTFLDRIDRQLADPEDDPGRHRDLLARTRDIEVSVTVVCLHEGRHGPEVSRQDSTQVELETGRPDRKLVPRLMARSLSLQHPGWVRRLLELDPPAAWKRVAPLHAARALVFDDHGCFVLNGHQMVLDPQLGLLFNTQADSE